LDPGYHFNNKYLRNLPGEKKAKEALVNTCSKILASF
jgi:hypothetical protein